MKLDFEQRQEAVAIEEWVQEYPDDAAEEIVGLRTRLQRAEELLREIERFGHNEGYGRGYTCANMAQAALDEITGESHD